MANENETQEVVDTETEPKQEEVKEETTKNEEKTFNQKEVDEIVKNRLAKEKVKYEKELEKVADYDNLKEVAAKVNDLENKLNNALSENETLKHEKDIASWKAEASKETGVAESILRGNSKEEIMEHAQAIKDTINYPSVKQGDNPQGEGFKSSPEDALMNRLDELM